MSTKRSFRSFACTIVAAVIGLTAVPAFATDTDSDGLVDSDESSIWSSNPSAADSDGDSLTDGDEVLVYGTSPTLADTDGDGTADNLDATPTHFDGTTYGGGNNATFTNGRTGTIGAVSGLSPYDGFGVLLVEGSLQYDFSVGHAKGVASLHHALGLHYDSQSLWDGHHGIGWVSIFDTQRTVNGAGDVTLHAGGQSLTWVKNGSGWTQPSKLPAPFVVDEYASGEYEFMSPGGGAMGVSANGIEYVKDRFGNQITYNWTSGAISSITDSRGASHTVEFYATGRLKKLTMADGAIWEFKYNTKDQLWKVIGPATTSFASGIDYEFRYTNGASSAAQNSNMVAAKDGRGYWWMRNAYDSSDRVTSQTVDSSGYFSFDYSAASSSQQVTVTDRIGNTRVWTWDSTKLTKASLVENTNRNVRTGEGNYTTSWTTDTDGYQTEVTYPEGNGVKTTLNSTKLPTAVRRKASMSAADGSSDLVQSYTYDSSKFYGCTQFTDELGNQTTYTLNAKGQPTTVTFPMVSGASAAVTNSYAYNSDGTLDTFTDGEGHVAKTTYYTTPAAKIGRVYERITDYGGLALTTTYDYEAWGDVKTVTDARGYTTTYTVERYGNVEQVAGPSALGYVTQYDYDGNLNVTQKRVKNIDHDGSWLSTPQWWTTNYGYNPMDTVFQINECVGTSAARTTYLYYDANDQLEKVTRESRETRMLYDERGLLYKRTRELGTTDAVEEFTYNGNRNLTASKNPRTYQTTLAYDGYDRVTRVTNALGHYEDRIYDKAGHVLESKQYEEAGATDVLLAHHKDTFDEMGRRWKEEDALIGGSTSWLARTFAFDDDSAVVTVTDRLSNNTTITYDAAGRRDSVTDPIGNLTEWEYDENGNVTATVETEKIPGSSSTEAYRTEMEYDQINRVKKRTEIDRTNSSNTKITEWKRSVLGVRQTIDPKGNTVTFALDGYGRTTEKSEDLGSSAAVVTQWTFNVHDQITKLHDDNGNDTDYTYGLNGLLTQKSYENTKTVSYQHDLNGNVTQIEDEIGTLIDQGFDDLDRLIGRDVTLGTGVGGDTTEDFAYDALNRLCQAKDDDSIVNLTFDSLSRVLTEVQGSNPLGTTGKTVSYSWNDESSRTKIDYPSGFDANEARDSLGRITAITDASSATVASFDLYGAGLREKKRTLANSTYAAVTYDGFRRPTDIDHKTSGGTRFAGFAYAWDKNDNPLMEQRSHQSGKGDVYSYDKVNRLTKVLRDVNDPVAELATPNSETYVNKLEYDMDDVFNLTAYKVTPYGGSTTTTSYTTDAMNQYTAIGSQSPTYTDAGSLKDDGTLLYKYDAHQHLIEVRLKSSNALVAEYAYDALGLGRRITKVVGSDTTRYVHAGQQAIEEWDGTGSGANLRRLYVFGERIDQIVAMEAPDQADVDSDTNTTEVLRFSFHTQLIGSVTQVTGPAGTVVESYEYDPYGKPTIKDQGGSTISASAIGNGYLFTARQLDEETGLYYYRARHYSADLRRFIQRDPLEYVDGPNAVGYVACHPARASDPTGLVENPTDTDGHKSPAPPPPTKGPDIFSTPKDGSIPTPSPDAGKKIGDTGMTCGGAISVPEAKTGSRYCGVDANFWVCGAGEDTLLFYQYVYEYVILDPVPTGKKSGTVPSTRTPSGYAPDSTGWIPKQNHGGSVGGWGGTQDKPGKMVTGDTGPQASSMLAAIAALLGKDGIPAGTKSVTLVSEFVTYAVLVVKGGGTKIVGWWEWSYSVKVNVGPPPSIASVECVPKTGDPAFHQAK